MAPRETEDNAYAKFWGNKQRALWYVMVFLEWSIGHVSVKSCLVAQQVNVLVLDYRTGHKPRLYVSFFKSFAV